MLAEGLALAVGPPLVLFSGRCFQVLRVLRRADSRFVDPLLHIVKLILVPGLEFQLLQHLCIFLLEMRSIFWGVLSRNVSVACDHAIHVVGVNLELLDSLGSATVTDACQASSSSALGLLDSPVVLGNGSHQQVVVFLSLLRDCLFLQIGMTRSGDSVASASSSARHHAFLVGRLQFGHGAIWSSLHWRLLFFRVGMV